MIDVQRLKSSFRYAFRGLALVFRSEQSFRIQVIVGIIVLLFGLLLGVRGIEMIIVLALVAVVLVLELINSILERVVDTFKPRLHPSIRDIKDMMAGSVLLASLITAIIGLVIFVPYLRALF